MAAVLVTLVQAKAHLRITLPALDPGDVDIQLKLDQAEAIVLEHVSATAWWAAIAVTWTAGTVPGGVQAAILVVLTHLFEHRGDDMELDEALWCAVDRLIALNRDPVIA
jgi:hypothetical protein